MKILSIISLLFCVSICYATDHTTNYTADHTTDQVKHDQVNELPIGLTLQVLDAETLDGFGIQNGGGLAVTEIENGSVAHGKGMRIGDVIIKINGAYVKELKQYRAKVLKALPNSTVTLEIFRNGVIRNMVFHRVKIYGVHVHFDLKRGYLIEKTTSHLSHIKGCYIRSINNLKEWRTHIEQLFTKSKLLLLLECNGDKRFVTIKNKSSHLGVWKSEKRRKNKIIL